MTIDPARLDRMFFALADVHRRSMLGLLSRGPASVSDLAEPLHIALPSAVKHLAVLEQGGFVASQKTGRVRTFQVDPKAFDAMGAWLVMHKTMLNAQFDRLDDYLTEQKGHSPR